MESLNSEVVSHRAHIPKAQVQILFQQLSYMRMLHNGIAVAFQATDVGSIPTIRSV